MLSLDDHRAMLAGFAPAGYFCSHSPTAAANPVRIEWHIDGAVRRFRLWAFDITHGGGGVTVRAADEFRIQITNGPNTLADFDANGSIDLLVGYSRDSDAIVAYDRRWLENWTRKREQTGSGGSPSVQVKEADIQAGHNEGAYRLAKDSAFGSAGIVTMRPTLLPAYLLNYTALLQGTMTAYQAQASVLSTGTTLVDYCREQGFPFEPKLIARYLAALLTKPFVILAGVSGTGKSKLAELVAEYHSRSVAAAPGPALGNVPATGETFTFQPIYGPPDRSRFALVAVRPDWIDNQSVLGFVNPITGQYESTQALDLILRAHRSLAAAQVKPQAPRYFMLLDEMNLARVEHYFSDWLACTESRRLQPDNTILQQAVPLYRSASSLQTTLTATNGTIEQVSVPQSIELPTNLIVTGTVNVDETTYGFSPKVLDRAMVLEFDEVSLERLRGGPVVPGAAGFRLPDTLPPFRLATPQDYANLPQACHQHLVAINGILEKARLHFGYRAANEMALFMKIYNGFLPEDTSDTEWRRALDAAVLQKVLPRLSGNRAKLEPSLASLCAYLRDLAIPADESASQDFDPGAVSRLPDSYRRAVEMLGSLRDFGFVSFFK